MSQVVDSMKKLTGNLERQGMSPQTQHKISNRIKLFAPQYNSGEPNGRYTKMGLVSEFTPPTDSREMTHLHGIGYGDQVAEVVPGKSADYKFDITRSALWTANIMQMFGYRAGTDGLVRALKYHRYPFDMKVEEVFSTIGTRIASAGEAGMETYTGNDDSREDMVGLLAMNTYYETCWIENYSYSVSYDTAIITEKISASVTDITTSTDQSIDVGYDTGNSPVNSSAATAAMSLLNAL